MRCLGVEIGGTKLQLVLGDELGKIRRRVRLKVDPPKGAAGVRAQIEQWLPDLIDHETIDAVGIGFGGPVDWRTAKICRSHQIEGWSDFDLGAWLRPLTGATVVADNDANVAAFGEALQGAGAGFNPVFYVTLGSGVGGGLVMNEGIYHGATPGESEIGHVRLDRAGIIVEASCSGWAVDKKIRAAAKTEPDGVLAGLIAGAPGSEAKQLAKALQKHDSAAKGILQATATDLAFGLSHVVHLFHPQAIILGGGLSGVGESLRIAVETALREFIMDAFTPGPRIFLAALSEDAVPIGALRLAALAARSTP